MGSWDLSETRTFDLRSSATGNNLHSSRQRSLAEGTILRESHKYERREKLNLLRKAAKLTRHYSLQLLFPRELSMIKAFRFFSTVVAFGEADPKPVHIDGEQIGKITIFVESKNHWNVNSTVSITEMANDTWTYD